MKQTLATAIIALSSLHCGSSSSDPSDAASSGNSGATGGSGGGSDAGGAGGSGGQPDAVDPCSVEALAEPIASTTYYLAIEEPGADNDACDGLAPTDEGNGHCPFRDLSSDKVRALFVQASDVRVELRKGTYVVSGWEGLLLDGVGRSASEPLVLSNYSGEEVVLDVPEPDGGSCTPENDPMSNPDCVRQILAINGGHTIVQGLTIQNGLGYNAAVIGHDVLIRCNLFRETVAFPLRSDSLKIADAVDVEVRHNEFTKFRSQAIDITRVNGVLVEQNDFHDPFDADAGAVGCKLGATDVTIRDNTIHDFGDDTKTRVFSMGGSGTPNDDEYLAHGIHAVGNRVWNVRGMLAQLLSCEDCSVEDNEVWDLSAGVHLRGDSTGSAQCSASSSGCLLSSNPKISGNRMRGLDGAGDPSMANIFIGVDANAAVSIEAATNTYCAPAASEARFLWEAQLLDFAGWVEASGTDSTSQTFAETDEACTSW